MIPDLEHKANNEKYFKSIRYFSHSLKGEKRRNFISQVAEHNIYLAAQCIMSAEKDDFLENELMQLAIALANNFKEADNSAKGFLALAEFENFNEIVSLLKDVKKPSKVHSQVFSKILEGKNSELFITFLDVLTKTKNITFIHYAINSYNGLLNVDSNNNVIIREALHQLFKNGNYGMGRIAIEKFGLYENLSNLLGGNIEKIIHSLLKSKKKVVQATKLAYEICNHFNYFSLFNPVIFINSYLKHNKGKSNKGLINAVDLAVKHKIVNNAEINKKVEHLLLASDKKNKNKLNQLIRKGLFTYLSNNQELLMKVKDFIEVPISYSKPIEATVINDEVLAPNSIEDNINELLNNSKNNIYIDKELISLQQKWSASLMEISHLLRFYELKGIVKHLMDYGCYVQPQSFRTAKLLFLHKNQITDKQEVNHPNEVLKEGDIITFRIIGINQQNHRLNISCLDSFNPENNAEPTDE